VSVLRRLGPTVLVVFAVVAMSCTDRSASSPERSEATSATSTSVRSGSTIGEASAAARIGATATDPPATNPPATTAATTTSSPTTSSPPTTVVTTTRPPATTVAATTTTAAPAPLTLSMAFTGDVLAHSPLWRRAARNAEEAGVQGYDFEPMLAGLAPLVGAVDVGVCHLETPIAPEGEELSTMPRYGVPPEIVGALGRVGYDRCSTASNHTLDRGFAGIVRTVDTFEHYGLDQVGMARTPAEIAPRVVDANGVRLTHLSYTWSYNGLTLPAGQEWQSALIDPVRILADAEAARALGAEVVIVSLHWGAEKRHAPTSYQRAVADELTADGTIDLIVGHHAHVLQPIEQVNGTWVMFGLGNVLSNMPTSDNWPAASQDAAVALVDLTVGVDGTVMVERPVVHPTWVDNDAGWLVRVVLDELARDDLSAGQRGRLQASLDRTMAVVGEFVARP
jgi:hypothetical protein